MVTLYTNKQQQPVRKVPVKTAAKRIKDLEINLTKNMQDYIMWSC